MSWWSPRPKPKEPEEPSPEPTPPAKHYDEPTTRYDEVLLDDVLHTLDTETKKLNSQRLELEIVLRKSGKEIGRKNIEIEFEL